MPRLTPTVCHAFAFAGLFAAGVVHASPVDDDFNDGVVGPQWTLGVDQPAALNLSESGGRLNLISAGGGSPNNDADYLSTFRLSTASDFSMRIDYALNGVSGGNGGDALGLVFGVGRDADGTDSAAIGVGFAKVFGANAYVSTVAYRVDDVQTTAAGPDLFSPPTGTLRIDYTAATDTLTLARDGFALGSPFRASLVGTVRGVWGATDGLLVSFGGRGSGFSTTTGQLTLDNFALTSGTIVPEPATLAVLGTLGLLLHRRRI